MTDEQEGVYRDTIRQLTDALRSRDDQALTMLESLGKQCETITAQGDQIVQLAKTNAELSALHPGVRL